MTTRSRVSLRRGRRRVRFEDSTDRPCRGQTAATYESGSAGHLLRRRRLHLYMLNILLINAPLSRRLNIIFIPYTR